MTDELCTALKKIIYHKLYCNLIYKRKVTKKMTVSFVKLWCSRGHPEFSGRSVSHLQTDQVEAHCYKSSNTVHTKILIRKTEWMFVNDVMKYCINILFLLLWQNQGVNIIKLCKKISFTIWILPKADSN